MKYYQYKMQWLFPVNGFFDHPKAQQRKELYTVLRILGARSLTEVVFRDNDLNIVDSYSNMVSYGTGEAEKQTIKAIKKALKNNENITNVELLRK